jgi:hypothetical protein
MLEPQFVETVKLELAKLGQQFNRVNEAHAANYFAILLALIEKGILTQVDYDAAKLKTIHEAEQEWARKRDETQGEGT